MNKYVVEYLSAVGGLSDRECVVKASSEQEAIAKVQARYPRAHVHSAYLLEG